MYHWEISCKFLIYCMCCTPQNQKGSWLDGSEWSYSDWMPGHPNIHTDKPVCVEMFMMGKNYTDPHINIMSKHFSDCIQYYKSSNKYKNARKLVLHVWLPLREQTISEYSCHTSYLCTSFVNKIVLQSQFSETVRTNKYALFEPIFERYRYRNNIVGYLSNILIKWVKGI